jgi:lysophospholipase L1-like esterase
MDDTPTPAYTTPEKYAENIQWIVESLRSNGVSVVIWGLNTPVQEEWHRVVPGSGRMRKMGRMNATIRHYNEIAIDVMNQMAVPVTDMFSPLWEEGVENVLLPDGVHLNHLGSAILGEVVAEAVREHS